MDEATCTSAPIIYFLPLAWTGWLFGFLFLWINMCACVCMWWYVRWNVFIVECNESVWCIWIINCFYYVYCLYYVCVCLCASVFLCVRACVCASVCICMCVLLCFCVCAHAWMCVYLCVLLRLCVFYVCLCNVVSDCDVLLVWHNDTYEKCVWMYVNC